MTNKRRMGIAVPIWMYEELKNEAVYSGQTLNALILIILRDWLETRDKEKV